MGIMDDDIAMFTEVIHQGDGIGNLSPRLEARGLNSRFRGP